MQRCLFSLQGRRYHSTLTWGLGFGLPQILGKCFSGSPSPYKHIYNLRLFFQYEKYYVFLNQGHYIILEAASSHSDGFEQNN